MDKTWEYSVAEYSDLSETAAVTENPGGICRCTAAANDEAGIFGSSAQYWWQWLLGVF